MENICKVMGKKGRKKERETKRIFERKQELCQIETSMLLKRNMNKSL